MNKKKLIVILIVVILTTSLCSSNVVEADIQQDLNDTIEDALDNIEFGQVDTVTDNGFFDNIVEKMKGIMSGEFDNAGSFLQFLADILLDNFKNILPTLVIIFVMCVLCSIITNNSNGFVSIGTSNVVYFVTFVMVVSSIATVLYGIFSAIAKVVASIGQLVDVSAPILLTLMIANGANVTAKVYQPTVALMSTTVVKLTSQVILPICACSFIFAIISNISKNVKVDKMTGFFSGLANWILGIVFMVFFSFLTVQGATAMSIDGVSIRAAKFATKNYIPILGGYLADGFDLIIASTTLVKNSFGIIMMLAMLSIIIAPLVNVLLYKFGLQLVGAIGEPVMDSRFVSLFSSVAKNLTFLAILLIALMFMCFLLVMLAIITANGI